MKKTGKFNGGGGGGLLYNSSWLSGATKMAASNVCVSHPSQRKPHVAGVNMSLTFKG